MYTVLVCREEVPNELSCRLYHLEVMLQQLNSDLERVRIFLHHFKLVKSQELEINTYHFPLSLFYQEKQDKVVLLAEMANLRDNNQRLQEESLTTTEQLRKFSRLFSNLEKNGE